LKISKKEKNMSWIVNAFLNGVANGAVNYNTPSNSASGLKGVDKKIVACSKPVISGMPLMMSKCDGSSFIGIDVEVNITISNSGNGTGNIASNGNGGGNVPEKTSGSSENNDGSSK
jgi:hypothetical protein